MSKTINNHQQKVDEKKYGTHYDEIFRKGKKKKKVKGTLRHPVMTGHV